MNRSFHDMNLFQDKKGFSLLEVLIAICLLSIAMMGLATLQSRGVRGNDLGNRTTQACALAQDTLERLINTSRGTTLDPGTSRDLNPVNETGDAGPGAIFTRIWTIGANGVPVSNAQEIGVTVEWTDIVGRHEVKVSSVITSDAY